jgi:hypothetical protein
MAVGVSVDAGAAAGPGRAGSFTASRLVFARGAGWGGWQPRAIAAATANPRDREPRSLGVGMFGAQRIRGSVLSCLAMPRDPRRSLAPLSLLLPLAFACAANTPYPTVEPDLALDSVVLYRNGVGYFERRGNVDGDTLTLRVRKDQVDDLLKSLTVVDQDGQAVSVSMPLDAGAWASKALAILGPGRGSLASVLDAMRGTDVSLSMTNYDTVRGRIVMVERIINEPDPNAHGNARGGMPATPDQTIDHRVTLLEGDKMRTVRLSRINGVKIRNGDLALQLHRNLDATAGEGMFEQVDVDLRLVGARRHRVLVSYVVSAPMWKPTYRVVLPEAGNGKALLQGWAVVDNLSGEDWREVNLSLTSGAPIAFRYDLHTPRDVPRPDLTGSAVNKRARVSLGETSFEDDEMEPESEKVGGWADAAMDGDMAGGFAGEEVAAAEAKPRPKRRGVSSHSNAPSSGYGGPGGMPASAPPAPPAEPQPSVDFDSLQRSTAASARAKQVTGLTRMDLPERVTVPDGTSTMVALVNSSVEAEQTFLYKPGGGGYGYESNPYRVVRFNNASDFVLEPGPIAIYSGGSFVGEGLSEAVGAKASVTIPFAVEPGIMVSSRRDAAGQELKLVRIVRGVLEAESFFRNTTTYEVKLQGTAKADRVYVRHPKYGGNYQLSPRPEGTEDLVNAYLIPVPVKGKRGELAVVEETPSKTSLSIWDGRAIQLLEVALASSEFSAADRGRLQPLVDARRAIGRIDTEIDGLRRQQSELDARARETRANLEAIKKDPAAGNLRRKLGGRLDEFTKEADAMGRKIVELNSKRLEKKIELEDALADFDLRPAKPKG